jgi:YfiR/HmsC-like
MRKPLPNTLLRMGLAIALSVFASAGEAQPIDEYQVKAAFLFNFAKFVEWPAQTFKSPTDPIAICVLGTNPFGHSLEDAVDGKSVEGRKFSVRQFNDPEQTAGCQILFVASRQKRPLSEAALLGVLTIGESRGFAADGGVIEFRIDHGKVRFEINLIAAEQRKIRISSKLLSLALIVRAQGG